MPELVRTKVKSDLSSTDLISSQLDTIIVLAERYKTLNETGAKVEVLADLMELIREIALLDFIPSDDVLKESRSRLDKLGTFIELKETK